MLASRLTRLSSIPFSNDLLSAPVLVYSFAISGFAIILSIIARAWWRIAQLAIVVSLDLFLEVMKVLLRATDPQKYRDQMRW